MQQHKLPGKAVSIYVHLYRLVLRILADCPDVALPLGVKYGCTVAAAKNMLHTAASMGLTVIGVR